MLGTYGTLFVILYREFESYKLRLGAVPVQVVHYLYNSICIAVLRYVRPEYCTVLYSILLSSSPRIPYS